MSTQDEEEVEDELAAMEARLNEEKEAHRAAVQRQDLPVAPNTELTTPEREPDEAEPARAKVAEKRQMLAA